MTDPRMETSPPILVDRSIDQSREKASPQNSLDTLINNPKSLINTRKKSLSACSKIFDLEKRPDFSPTF